MNNPETVNRCIHSDHTYTPFCLWICLWKTLVTSTAQRGKNLENVWFLHGLGMVESKTLHTHYGRLKHISHCLCIVVYSFSLCKVIDVSNYVIKHIYRLTIKKTVHNLSRVNRRLGVAA